ncbi:hypothetical protein [Streptomyces sp. SID8352]|uniref:hypothetical protein n=1 Tax=Streptomyces sp. SID8352 TaxID=2690338 RepID=UPI00136A5A46|nr:hypothetical protein [Streptomyces sp. SID8352]MYU21990.1 hypothetical protein [Streptomyces sp. SID8352]
MPAANRDDRSVAGSASHSIPASGPPKRLASILQLPGREPADFAVLLAVRGLRQYVWAN